MKQKLTRSENMARIRGKNTKPEILLRKVLWAEGLRYQIHTPLPGRPDIVFKKARLAIFVDGCFWHGCPIHYSAPHTRQEFWKQKLRSNVLRDMAADDALISDGWQVMRIWQHELSDIEKIVQNISDLIENSKQFKKSEKFIFYKTDTISVAAVSEPMTQYGHQTDRSETWWMCSCGNNDVKVLSLDRPGSLRPNSNQKPNHAELICRKCKQIWVADVAV